MLTFVIKQTSVDGHGLGRGHATRRAGQYGFKDGVVHCGITGSSDKANGIVIGNFKRASIVQVFADHSAATVDATFDRCPGQAQGIGHVGDGIFLDVA